MLGRGLALLAAVVAVSWAAILIRLCEAPSAGIAFYRLLFASLALVPFGSAGLRRAARATVAPAVAAGVLLAVHFATWIASLSYTSVASSVMLVSSQPVFVALLGPLLLRETPGRRGLLGVLLALLGIGVLAGGDLQVAGRALIGDLLALAGALSGALYLMIGRRVRAGIGFVSYLLLVNLCAAASLLALALLAGARLHGYPAATWVWLVALAAGPHLLGHGLLNWSVRRLRPLAVTVAALGEPVLATLYAAWLFREIPGAAFYPGAALIAAGVVLALREEATRPRAREEGPRARI